MTAIDRPGTRPPIRLHGRLRPANRPAGASSPPTSRSASAVRSARGGDRRHRRRGLTEVAARRSVRCKVRRGKRDLPEMGGIGGLRPGHPRRDGHRPGERGSTSGATSPSPDGRIAAVEPHIGLGRHGRCHRRDRPARRPGPRRPPRPRLLGRRRPVDQARSDAISARGATTIVDAGSAGANTFPGFRRVRHRPVRGRVPRLPQHQRDGPDRPVPRRAATTCATSSPSGRPTASRGRTATVVVGFKVRAQRGARRAERDRGAGPGGRGGHRATDAAGHGPHRRLDRHASTRSCPGCGPATSSRTPSRTGRNGIFRRRPGASSRSARRGARARRPVRRRPWRGFLRVPAGRGRAGRRLPARHHQLRPPSLQRRRAGLRPRDHAVQVPAPRAVARRGRRDGDDGARRGDRPRRAQFGTLAVGAVADVAVLALEEGRFPFTDSIGTTVRGPPARCEPVATIRAGRPRLTSGRVAAVWLPAVPTPRSGTSPRGPRRPGPRARPASGSRSSGPIARSTNRSTTRSNDHVTSSSVSSTVMSSCSPRLRRDAAAGRVRAAAGRARRSRGCWSWCEFRKLPQGMAAPETVPIAPSPKRSAIASWSSTAPPAGPVSAATSVARSGSSRKSRPETVRELALAVAAARYLRVAPCLGSWR